ncbi:MAG: D-alanine--D-alanine ligase [Bacteroidales bacterium]|nr:D-alanine--D-alanine ligase [Bacteroidales bacterium]
MKLKLGVLFGGRSVENEISVVTAIQTVESLDKEKYDVIPIYIAKNGRWYTSDELLTVSAYKDIEGLLKRSTAVAFRPEYGNFNLYRTERKLFGKDVVAHIDVILPCLHGTNCEDGTVQGILESIGIPFVGCGVLASANGMDKITMKMILKESGIPVVDYTWLCDKEWYLEQEAVIARIEGTLGYPVIVKPANSGSSVGISAAHNREELVKSVTDAAQFTTRIIVERLVTALKEINCSVMGDYYDCTPSVCESPARSGEILSYADKYEGGAKGGVKGGVKGAKCGVKGGVKLAGAKGGASLIGAKGGAKSQGMASCLREMPARLPEGETEKIQDLAVRTFKTLSCCGLSRIDFMIDETTRNIYVNEINTIPGSLSCYLWEATGKPFPQVVDSLIDLAFARSREAAFKTVDFGGNIFAHLGK